MQINELVKTQHKKSNNFI